jgi:hypothetical protein
MPSIIAAGDLPFVTPLALSFLRPRRFWQNNTTATASFTNFAFLQDTPEGLVSDAAQVGVVLFGCLCELWSGSLWLC